MNGKTARLLDRYAVRTGRNSTTQRRRLKEWYNSLSTTEKAKHRRQMSEELRKEQ